MILGSEQYGECQVHHAAFEIKGIVPIQHEAAGAFGANDELSDLAQSSLRLVRCRSSIVSMRISLARRAFHLRMESGSTSIVESDSIFRRNIIAIPLR